MMAVVVIWRAEEASRLTGNLSSQSWNEMYGEIAQVLTVRMVRREHLQV